MKVYAYFTSSGAAEAAENEIRGRISSARRITRITNGIPTDSAALTDSAAGHSNWMLTPNSLFQSSAWLPLSTQAQPQHERRTSYAVCVEGGRECVDSAARLLRSLGGTGIVVTAI